MKRLKIFLLIIVLAGIKGWAASDRIIPLNRIPQKAQAVVAKHFAGAKVSYVKMDDDLFSKTYDVVFTNGNKIEFDKKGNWKEIDCKYSRVPSDLVPTPILRHISSQYPDLYIVQIDRDSRDYEVELNNGLELVFSLKGVFKRFHD